MRKVWYISPIAFGAGPHGADIPQIQQFVEQNGLATATGQYIKTIFPTKGQNWCIVVLNIADHSSVKANTDFHALPEIAFDIKTNSVAAATMKALRNKADALGIDLSFLDVTGGKRDAMRDVFQACISTLQDNIDADSVDDLPG